MVQTLLPTTPTLLFTKVLWPSYSNGHSNTSVKEIQLEIRCPIYLPTSGSSCCRTSAAKYSNLLREDKTLCSQVKNLKIFKCRISFLKNTLPAKSNVHVSSVRVSRGKYWQSRSEFMMDHPGLISSGMLGWYHPDLV